MNRATIITAPDATEVGSYSRIRERIGAGALSGPAINQAIFTFYLELFCDIK